MKERSRPWLAVALAGLGALGLSIASRAAGSADEESAAPPVASIAAQPALASMAPPQPAVLIGDASLSGDVLFDKIELEGDEYRAPLRGGGTAVLTLDPALQKGAEAVLERAKAPLGAIVVTSVDGRVLAYAGRRNEEPAKERDFELPAKVWAPAASIFKIVTCAALLSSGVDPSQEVCYHGGIRSVDPSHLKDDPKRDRQCNSLEYGLAKSQNAIIAKLANRHLNRDSLRKFAKRFGFDRSVPFAITTEPNACSIPAEPLEMARTSAGFWNSELSPLGGAVLANVVASGGLEVVPRIVASVVHKDGSEVPIVGPAPTRVIEPEVAKGLSSMMATAVSQGTARRGFYDRRGQPFLKFDVAGKTGSLSRNEPTYHAYSWFVGFGPVENPQYVISVLLANPMKWHLKASTAARLVLQEAEAPAVETPR